MPPPIDARFVERSAGIVHHGPFTMRELLMNAKQAITVAAVLGATALGLAVPAYADDDFDHRGHGPTVTEHQCRKDGGHVRDEDPSFNIIPAVPAVPPTGNPPTGGSPAKPAVPVAGNYPHCHGGRYSGMQVSTDDD